MGANKENKIDVKNIIKESAVVLVLVAIIIVFSFLSPQFFKVSNFITILRQISILAIVSVGMTVVLISGGIDLSVGSIISVVSVLTAMSAVYGKLPTGVAIVIGLLLGTLMGLINGVMITMTGMPPMIGTLATQMIFRGLGFFVCDGASVYHLPEEFKIFGQGYVGPIPVPVLIMVIILVIFAFILGRTYIGRYFYAVGSNAEATRLCGLNTQKIQIFAYMLCGFLSAIGGIIMTSRVNSGQPKAGDGYEMDVLTACVVGGISINGGEGKIRHIVVGVLIIGILSNGLTIIGVSEYWQQVAKGLILAAAVAFDAVQKTRKKA